MLALTTVLLAACTTTKPVATQPTVANFTCQTGDVISVNYINNDRIEVQVAGKTAVMDSAVSASGARYVGQGGEWHEKGDEGLLTIHTQNGKAFQVACKK